MRHVIWISSVICGIYGVLTSIFVARVGVMNGISQLVAAGGAESLGGLLCVIAGLLILWRVWLALAGFVVNLVWCSAIATVYADQTVWIWCLVNALFAGFCAVVMRKRNQAKKQPRRVQSRRGLSP